MKEDPSKLNQKPSQTNTNTTSSAPGVSEEMERLVQLKVDQLNKAMEKFNQESDFHNKKRLEYEKLI